MEYVVVVTVDDNCNIIQNYRDSPKNFELCKHAKRVYSTELIKDPFAIYMTILHCKRGKEPFKIPPSLSMKEVVFESKELSRIIYKSF